MTEITFNSITNVSGAKDFVSLRDSKTNFERLVLTHT